MSELVDLLKENSTTWITIKSKLGCSCQLPPNASTQDIENAKKELEEMDNQIETNRKIEHILETTDLPAGHNRTKIFTDTNNYTVFLGSTKQTVICLITDDPKIYKDYDGKIYRRCKIYVPTNNVYKFDAVSHKLIYRINNEFGYTPKQLYCQAFIYTIGEIDSTKQLDFLEKHLKEYLASILSDHNSSYVSTPANDDYYMVNIHDLQKWYNKYFELYKSHVNGVY